MGTRLPHPVTFTCEHCGQEVTEERPPGPLPRYCTPCAPEAQRAMNRRRVHAHRERQWLANPYTHRRPGRRPRKG